MGGIGNRCILFNVILSGVLLFTTNTGIFMCVPTFCELLIYHVTRKYYGDNLGVLVSV